MATKDYEKKMKELIDVVISQDGSDLHFSVGRQPTIRVAGLLAPLVKEEKLTGEDTSAFANVLLTPEQQTYFERKKEIDFAYTPDGKARFRCNCFIQRGVVGIAMRLIPEKIRTLEELNLPDRLYSFVQMEQGFFLVVGPVGHGKTTTLAALVEYINEKRTAHIITIEDPIEYNYTQKQSLIDQREVGRDTKNFTVALKSMFRQDVDVVMVGEMRGLETISIAVTAGETGHLVLSTLHTNTAAQTIDRIIDSFPASQQDQIRTQLASSLTGILSQRLIPRVSGGVIPAYELLIKNNAVANLIRESRVHEIDNVIETNLEEGMVSIERTLADLVREGEVTIENARRYSLRPKLLEKLI